MAKGIYVDREYLADTEKKRKTLLPILKAAKRLAEYKRQSRLDDDKLVLKGRPYTVSILNQLPDELNAFKVTSKEDSHTLGFLGEINPLSNFHESPFTHEGTQYISSEQFIQVNKAKYFGDLDTYRMILGCSTSLECKILSKQIRNVDESKWEEAAGAVCYPGIQAKFQQNPYATDTLIQKTGNKRIVECASDRLWATGIPLSDPNCLDDTKWISQGILGQMLEIFVMIKSTAREVHLALDIINNQPLPSTLPKSKWQAQICLNNSLQLLWTSLRQLLPTSRIAVLLRRNPFLDQSLQVPVPQAVRHLTLQ